MKPSASGDFVLAEHTNEAIRIVLCDGLVYKYLRSHDSFQHPGAEARIRQLRLRAAESRLWPELNPMTFDEAANCIVSPHVTGRIPSRQELFALRRHFQETHRGYIEDIGRNNVIVVEDRPIMIDFSIDENHPDYLARLPRSDRH